MSDRRQPPPSLPPDEQDGGQAAPRCTGYVFASVDLVNSTAFKAMYPGHWPTFLLAFYRIVGESFARTDAPSDAPVMSHWKYLGDEVIYYLPVVDVAVLPRLVARLHSSLLSCNEKLADRLRGLLGGDTPRQQGRARAMISVKGACWFAEAAKVPERTVDGGSPRGQTPPHGPPNIILDTESLQAENLGVPVFDFVGPDIDTGFRVSAASARLRLTVAADLAYMILRHAHDPDVHKSSSAEAAAKGIADNLRIVDFRSLKGIWDGRPYPLVWYEPDWKGVPASFAYDEPQGADLYSELERAVDESERWTLEEVLRQAGVLEDIEQRYERLCDDERGADVAGCAPLPYAEVHVALLLIHHSESKVLLLKRPDAKERLPGYWGFGCAQLTTDESFGRCLARTYPPELGLPDSERERLERGADLTPVSTFNVSGRTGVIPGVVFAMRLEADFTPELEPTKHEECRWVAGGAEVGALGDHFDDVPDAVDAALRLFS